MMNNRKNKSLTILMSGVLALIAGVATTPAAFAHTQRYWVGHADGIQRAFDDYRNGNSYDSSCPTRDDGSSHTSNYCAGYTDGYSAGWTTVWHYYHVVVPQKNQQQIEQSSSVNVKGNNNRVVITQQANNGADQPISGYPVYGSSDGSDGHDKSSSSGGQSNPRCVILCANVRIN